MSARWGRALPTPPRHGAGRPSVAEGRTVDLMKRGWSEDRQHSGLSCTQGGFCKETPLPICRSNLSGGGGGGREVTA